jgi:CheY-like chemotaxis protein
MMGGEMWVESTFGDGATFHFRILAKPADPVAARTYPDGFQSDLAGKRLLFVDDSAANREIFKHQTEAWGFATRTTGSPLEALEWIRAGERFDIVVLDHQMPEMDGVALARSIRSHLTSEQLPLVLFSSLGRGAEMVSPDLFLSHLHKPLKPSALYDSLVDVLKPDREPTGSAVPQLPLPRSWPVFSWASLCQTVSLSPEAGRNLNGTPEPLDSSPMSEYARTPFARVHRESARVPVSVTAIQRSVLCLLPNFSLPLWSLLSSRKP